MTRVKEKSFFLEAPDNLASNKDVDQTNNFLISKANTHDLHARLGLSVSQGPVISLK